MAFPTQREIEIPLLHALVDPCGEARPIDIYTAVAAGFPDLTAEDQRQRLEPGAVKWERTCSLRVNTYLAAGRYQACQGPLEDHARRPGSS